MTGLTSVNSTSKNTQMSPLTITAGAAATGAVSGATVALIKKTSDVEFLSTAQKVINEKKEIEAE